MLSWSLPVSPEVVRDRLLETVDNVGVPFPVVFATGSQWFIECLVDYKPGERRLLGTVTRFDFRLLLRTERPSVFSTIASGFIRARPNGCEVRTTFRFHGAVVFFFWVTVLWFLTIALFLYPADPFPSGDWWRTRVAIPAAILLAAGGLLVYARWRRRKEEAELTMLLEHVLGPPPREPSKPQFSAASQSVASDEAPTLS